MSTPSAIIAKARRQTHSNSVSYTDSDAILDLNNRYQTIIWRIQTEVDEWHFWTWVTDTTTSGQSEYNISEMSTWLKINQIDKISIKFFSTDTNFTPLTRVDFNTLDLDLATYSDWAWTPFYFVKDNSVFVYPTPSQTVAGGVKAYVIYQPDDVTTSSTEDDLAIAPRFHQYLVDGMCAEYWYANGNENKGQFYDAKFDKWVNAMISAMKNRAQEPVEFVVSTNPYE